MSTKKRGQGEGNIYERNDGRWAARLSVGYRNGKRSRRWVYGELAAKNREEIACGDPCSRAGFPRRSRSCHG